jgi:hypothetical protein
MGKGKPARIRNWRHFIVTSAALALLGCGDSSGPDDIGRGLRTGEWSVVTGELSSTASPSKCFVTATVRITENPTTDATGRFDSDLIGSYREATMNCGAGVIAQPSGTLFGHMEGNVAGFEMTPILVTLVATWTSDVVTGTADLVQFSQGQRTWSGTFTATRIP